MKYKKDVFQSFAMIMQFGLTMLVPIFLCSFIGIFLGNKLHIPILMIPFFLLGAAAGFRNVFIMARSIYGHKKEEHDDKKQDQ